ncbi:hypothetical protein M438DRAFT_357075 [Aureobasidium pullulans EXF-150]|uniref:Uncharacterized protein n=1 Tax=Aureobasidium pullulans EXF-150 TaxID=1043002 RepID=A0A074XAH2_AURPU|nr:uncharacterized protein M438DRAFT_357075 [Aureobasidium pullulans EXF-150]KEQ82530.1 hypothetical protein M438DRAFT_357075 [Aureobasidium pullulans EXF-150]
MSSIHYIIKFYFRKRPIFNVASIIEDYAIKHTRIATPNVVIFDKKIATTNITLASRSLEVPLINSFKEDIGDKGKGKGKTKIIAKSKVKVTKTKVGKKAKVYKRVSFLIEDDKDNGPIRRLTLIRN